MKTSFIVLLVAVALFAGLWGAHVLLSLWVWMAIILVGMAAALHLAWCVAVFLFSLMMSQLAKISHERRAS